MLNFQGKAFLSAIVSTCLLRLFHLRVKTFPSAAISSTTFLHAQTNTLLSLTAAMDLPADLLPVHSCPLCEKYILDPKATGQREIGLYRRSWRAFDPELTIGKLRELGQHGCLFGESVYPDLTLYESPLSSDSSPVLYDFIPWQFDRSRYRGVMFGVQESPNDGDENEVGKNYDHQDGEDKTRSSGITVYIKARYDLMTTSGTCLTNSGDSDGQD